MARHVAGAKQMQSRAADGYLHGSTRQHGTQLLRQGTPAGRQQAVVYVEEPERIVVGEHEADAPARAGVGRIVIYPDGRVVGVGSLSGAPVGRDLVLLAGS